MWPVTTYTPAVTTPATPRKKRTPPYWGRNIKRILEAKKLKVKDVAAGAGMSSSQFSNLTNDDRLDPAISQIDRMAKSLGVNLGIVFAPADPQEVSLDAARVNPAIDPAIVRRELTSVLLDALSAAVATLTRSDPRFGQQSADPPLEESSEGRGARRRG